MGGQGSLGLITDQVATASCTDCVQARRLTFEASVHPGEAARAYSGVSSSIYHSWPPITQIAVGSVEAKPLFIETLSARTA